MPAGLQLYRKDGQLVFDSSTSNRYAKMLGMVELNGSLNGSISHHDLDKGVPFYFVIGDKASINVFFNGTTMTWKKAPPGFNNDRRERNSSGFHGFYDTSKVKILYGVY